MFAAIYIPDLPLEAVLRAEPDLRDQATAVTDGKPPVLTVLAANERARDAGAEPGMTALQVATAIAGVNLRPRSSAQETSAHAALLDCAQAFSPRLEDTAPDTVVLDLAGLDLLFGAPAKIARDVARRASELGLEANVATAGNPDAAVHAAMGFPGITVIPPGKEAERLGELPIDVLLRRGLEAKTASDLLDTLDRWGVRTFRALAALPEIALSERLGQTGLHLQRLARGAVQRTLIPAEPPLTFEETMELEYPVEMLEPLAFILRRLLEQLCARLGARALATNELRLEMELADEVSSFEKLVRLRLPVPMLDTRVFLKLLQLELKAHPPQAPVVKVTLAAEPVMPRRSQAGLFVPLEPEPERLELTLARLSGIAGEDRVGAAEVLNTHRPCAFRMARFSPALLQGKAGAARGSAKKAVMALRRFRPPLKARVQLQGEKPARLWTEDGKVCGEVISSSGPWRTSGEWWNDAEWHRDDWDIALADGTSCVLYRIFCDRLSGKWFVEGSYD
ncbi:MAG: DNA polymerase Y family protein [Acidobacteriaceae bacterium]|nr:DNA polymerase Y family protein [Acidobacteriaceae bacterium]